MEQRGRDLTSGNLKKQLWLLAWPVMLSIFFHTLYNIVDTIWVGRLSTEAIAAVSIAQISLFAMVALSMGITVGSGVRISMRIGMKDKPGAERVLGQSFVLSAIIGVFFTVISLVFKDVILTLSGATGEVFQPASEYFTIVSAGAILMFTMMTIVFAFNSQGDNFTPTKLFAVSTLINLVLDPVLIFGWGVAPELGIAGAAYATLVSQAFFIVAAMYILSRETQFIPFHMRNLTLRWESVKEVFKIGIPASLTQVLQPIGLAALMYITAQQFAELGTVAFSIAFRLEFFAYLPAIGFGVGLMAIVGQCIGANNYARAREAYTLALQFGIASAVFVSLMGLVVGSYMVKVFSSDEVVIEYLGSYFVTTGLSYAFLATTMISVFAFQAMSKSWVGFWLTMLRFMVVSIPLAYASAVVLETSIQGIWVALALGNIIAALIGVYGVRRTFASLSAKV